MAPGFSQVLVDVLECDATIDHHDLQMVDELAHFFGRAISTLIFGGDPGLSSLFDDLLADEMRALAQFVNSQRVREPACLVAAFSLNSANSDSKVFIFVCFLVWWAFTP